MIRVLLASLQPAVTWIKVEKPSFDLVGVVLSSFRLAGVLLVLALGLGLLLGTALLRARRRRGTTPIDAVSLHLGTPEARSGPADLGSPASPVGF